MSREPFKIYFVFRQVTFSPHKKLHIGDKRAFPRVCSSTMHLQNNAQRVIVGKDTTSIHLITSYINSISSFHTSLSQSHRLTDTITSPKLIDTWPFRVYYFLSLFCLVSCRSLRCDWWYDRAMRLFSVSVSFSVLLLCQFIFIFSCSSVIFIIYVCLSFYLIMLLLVVCGRKGMKAMDKQRDGGIPRSHETTCQPGTCY